MSDLISRQAAIDAIEKYFAGLSIQGHYDMVQIVKDLPTAKMQMPMLDTESWKITVTDMPIVEYAPVKHGKWIEPSREVGLSYDKKAYAECSVCCKKEFLGWGKAFCPNCGAKMDEVEE